MASEYAGYSVRPCRGHWHVTVDGEDVGDSYPTWQAAWAGIADLHRSLNLTGSPTPAQRLVDETDAGAVPGCTTECERIQKRVGEIEPNAGHVEAWLTVCAALDKATPHWRNGSESAIDNAVSAIRSLASLRADAEAVRAENEGLRAALAEINDPVQAMRERLPEGKTLNGAIAATLADNAGYLRGIAARALMARRQEEGQTDNG